MFHVVLVSSRRRSETGGFKILANEEQFIPVGKIYLVTGKHMKPAVWPGGHVEDRIFGEQVFLEQGIKEFVSKRDFDLFAVEIAVKCTEDFPA